MKIRVIAVGGLKQEYAQVGCEMFMARLRSMCRFELIEIKDSKRTLKGDANRWRSEEADRITQALGGDRFWVALDERGTSWTSRELSTRIERAQVQAITKLSFVIGGPDGLSADLLKSAPSIMNLGVMTYPHELARLILLEQLYRAHTILTNTGYHRD
jgi:23S rRNA (pseudouridine1915-N3)-methyltransferase